jgi:hypothetical protein
MNSAVYKFFIAIILLSILIINAGLGYKYLFQKDSSPTAPAPATKAATNLMDQFPVRNLLIQTDFVSSTDNQVTVKNKSGENVTFPFKPTFFVFQPTTKNPNGEKQDINAFKALKPGTHLLLNLTIEGDQTTAQNANVLPDNAVSK